MKVHCARFDGYGWSFGNHVYEERAALCGVGRDVPLTDDDQKVTCGNCRRILGEPTEKAHLESIRNKETK